MLLLGPLVKIAIPVLLGLGIFFGLVGTLHNSGVRSAQRDIAVQELEHSSEVGDFALEQMRWLRHREHQARQQMQGEAP